MTPSDADVELLWASAAPAPDPHRVATAAREADVSSVLETARGQRVGPLVLRALESVDVPLGPDGPVAVRDAAFRRAQAAVTLPLVLEHAVGRLHDAGFTPLVLKGAALAERYPAPGLRPMDDVDLVLPPFQHDAAIEVLCAAGWSLASHSAIAQETGYDIPLVHPVAALPIELHWNLHRRTQRTNGVDAARLWDERVEATVGGWPAWGSTPELELMALATHAAKPFHVFNRMIWAVDIAVVAAAPGFDWDIVARRSVELRCRAAVAVALAMGRRLGADVPDELVSLPRFARRTGALAPLLDPRWPFVAATAHRSSLAMALVDDGPARARLAVDEVLHPEGQRSHVQAAGALLLSAARLGRRVAVSRRAGPPPPTSPSRGGGALAGGPRSPAR